jgi:hypothetical protein
VKRAEVEPRADEQEIGIVADEINERFGLQKEMDESIRNRMNGLAEILMRESQPMANANSRRRRFEVRLSDEEESAMINDLEKLLETFERDQVWRERFAEVMLEDLLEPHRSFQIY